MNWIGIYFNPVFLFTMHSYYVNYYLYGPETIQVERNNVKLIIVRYGFFSKNASR